MSKRFKCPIAVYLFYIRNNQLLLLLRKGQSFNGMYSTPSGHVDGNERIIDACIREAKEEVGLELSEQDIKLAATYHSHFGSNEYLHFFYTCTKPNLTPTNCEEDKCEHIKFFDIDNLPANIIPPILTALEAIENNQTFVEDTFPF